MRTSDRVDVQIPIQIVGEDLTSGTTFVRDCETKIVSRHGATVALNRMLSVNQEVTIRCLLTNEEAKARVVGLIQRPGTDLVYGLAFLQADANPWGIEFPLLTEPDDGLMRLLLNCEGCGRNEVLHLNEIEVEVLASIHSLRLPCPSCHAIRYWRQTTERASQAAPGPHPAPPAKSAANRRKDRRVRTAISACIRRPSFNEEIVTCDDVSRGGMQFKTRKKYQVGDRIEVAIPYSRGAANIYVSARVAHIRRIDESFVVGLSFAPDFTTKPLAVPPNKSS